MTIKSFFDMNFGENSYELTKMIDPMMSGIFAGDVNELSVKATMGGFLSFLKDSWIKEITPKAANSWV